MPCGVALPPVELRPPHPAPLGTTLAPCARPTARLTLPLAQWACPLPHQPPSHSSGSPHPSRSLSPPPCARWPAQPPPAWRRRQLLRPVTQPTRCVERGGVDRWFHATFLRVALRWVHAQLQGQRAVCRLAKFWSTVPTCQPSRCSCSHAHRSRRSLILICQTSVIARGIFAVVQQPACWRPSVCRSLSSTARCTPLACRSRRSLSLVRLLLTLITGLVQLLILR